MSSEPTRSLDIKMEDAGGTTLSKSMIKTVNLQPDLSIMDHIRLEDIETPTTPDSFKGEASSDSVKTESPKVMKPVLGKLQAKKRLMAFANKFNTMPKINKLKIKPDKIKRQEKILAIEEIVREENQSRLAAQELRDINERNLARERRIREERRNDEERYSRKSGLFRRRDRERRYSRDRRSRSRSRQRSNRRSPRADERHDSRHKEKKSKKDKSDKDRKDDSKNKEENSKFKEDLKSETYRKEDMKETIEDDKKIDFKQDSRNSESGKSDHDIEIRGKEEKQNLEKETLSRKEKSKSKERSKEVIDESRREKLKHDNLKEISPDKSKDTEKINEDSKKDKKSKVKESEKIEIDGKESSNSTKSNKEDRKSELKEQEYDKMDLEKKEELKLDKSRKDSRSELIKKDEFKLDKSKKEEFKCEDLKLDLKQDSDWEDKNKQEDISIKRGRSRDKKLEKGDSKEKRDEPRMKIYREREREKDKLREIREKELSKCCSWKDFCRYGFHIDDVGYIRRNDNVDKTKSKSGEDYNALLEQVLMLQYNRLPYYSFLAEGLDGTKEYPPQMIKETKHKPSVFYCENPEFPFYYERKNVLKAVSPNRREKMEDICGATQIRIITSEREEGHHERQWYKTLDPTKSISIRSSVDVPSFPRSKWDSENEYSDNDNVFENSPDDFILTKEPIPVAIQQTPVEPEVQLKRSKFQSEKKSPSRTRETEIVLEKEREIDKLESESEVELESDHKTPVTSPLKLEMKERKQNSTDSQSEEQFIKSKHKHKNKHKHSHSPSPKKKDKSPSHKKHKEDKYDKNKHDKHRSREDKHHHHHRQHKDKKHATDELKEIQPPLPLIEKSTKAKTPSPVPEIGDEKLVSEYEQFMKMVSSVDTTAEAFDTNSKVVEVMHQEVSTSTVSATSPSAFYEFSLEAKVSKDTSDDLRVLDIPLPSPKLIKEIIDVPKIDPLKKINKKDKDIIKEKVCEKVKEPERIFTESSPEPEEPEPCNPESGESEVDDESSEDDAEEDEDSRSIPSDWENVKIKKEKVSDAEDSEGASSSKIKVTKKKRKRCESYSSDSSSSTSSDSDDSKRKKRKRKRKRQRKASSNESESSDSSSSDSSSSEEVRKKKKKKADKKKKKKRRKLKKLNKKLKRKRKRKASTDSSSSDSDVRSSKKKSRKAKKKKTKTSKQSSEDVVEKTKTKEKSNEEKCQKTPKVKDESKKSGKNKQADVESDDFIQPIVAEEIKLVKSPPISEKRKRHVSEETNSDWERESMSRQIIDEPDEGHKSIDKSKMRKSSKIEEISEDKNDNINRKSKIQEKENKEVIESERKDVNAEEIDSKKNKKKKDKESKKECQEFENNWEKEEVEYSAKPAKSEEEMQKFVGLEKKTNSTLGWNDTDFNSLDVFSLTQLHLQNVSERRNIFVNEWEVDSMEALPQPLSAKLEQPKLKKIVKEIGYDQETDTYIPVEIEKSKEKKKKDKRNNAIRIWEDEQENAEREEMTIVKKKSTTESKEKISDNLEDKIIETAAVIIVDDKPRRRSRWDIENQSEGFENAPSVNWEEETNIWSKSSTNQIPDIKPELSFDSPPLEGVRARILNESLEKDTLIADDFILCKDDVPVSPDSVRRKIAMVDKDLNTSDIEQKLIKLKEKSFEVKDNLDLEPPKQAEIAALKERNIVAKKVQAENSSKSKDSSLKRNKDDKLTPSDWEGSSAGPLIDEASEFGIPALSEIDSKIEEPSDSSYRDIFLDIESIAFDSGLSKKAEKKSVEELDEKSREMLTKLVPKQVLSKKKLIEDTHEIPKPTEVKLDDKPKDLKSSPNDRKRSPSRKERDGDRSKSASKNSERESKDKKDHRSSKRSSPSAGWDSRDLTKNESLSRTVSHSRSRSTSRSRSPRRRDERSKHGKRDRRSRSPAKDSSRRDSKKSSHSSKGDRNKRRYDDKYDQDKSRDKPYDPMEILRERNFENERIRRSRIDEDIPKSWRQPDCPDDKLSINPYPNNYNYENKSLRDESLDKESKSLLRPANRSRDRDKRDRRDSRSPDSPSGRRDKSSRKSPSRSLRRSPPPRSRYRSRSRSWSRSLTRSRSRSRSCSRSRSDSRTRYRNQDSRRRSRSYSPVRNRYSDDRKYDDERSRMEDDFRRLNDRLSPNAPRSVDVPCITPIRPLLRMDTIIQLTGSSEMHEEVPLGISGSISIGNDLTEMSACSVPAQYRYPNEGGTEAEYNTYYQGRNLTYPKIADETSTDSPKRLSLDERLELELGIKKDAVPLGFGSPGFIPQGPGFPPQVPHHGHFPRQTVVQVGNVLQVVPSEYPVRPEQQQPPPAVIPTNQIVRVGNVLQVVPTTVVDWSPAQQSPASVSAPPPAVVRYAPPPVIAGSSPAIASPLPTVPIVGQLPPVVKPIMPVVPSPQVISSPAVAFPAPKPPPPEPVVQPVYNYEAILEARHMEKEERKRQKEMKRKEKERRHLERVKRRAEKLLSKSKLTPTATANSNVLANIVNDINESVINEEGAVDEAMYIPTTSKETGNILFSKSGILDEEADGGDDEEEDEQQHVAAGNEGEIISSGIDVQGEEGGQEETRQEEYKIVVIPPPPAKGILILPGFGNISMSNGIINDLGDTVNEKEKDEPINIVEKTDKDDESKLVSLSFKLFERTRKKKSVQFADGIKPGEGTSPSGGEGDMPSPPPPNSKLPKDLLDISKTLRAKKLRKKQQKRLKPVKIKKKVKVKVIKLKKPKVTPITAMLQEDSDEMDDRSPPPPPPGSPPPPHLWPSYLQTYGPNGSTTTSGARSTSSTTTTTSVVTTSSTLTAPLGPAPPTPLPLLVPPPPLNYSIQPCSRA